MSVFGSQISFDRSSLLKGKLGKPNFLGVGVCKGELLAVKVVSNFKKMGQKTFPKGNFKVERFLSSHFLKGNNF